MLENIFVLIKACALKKILKFLFYYCLANIEKNSLLSQCFKNSLRINDT